MIKSPSLDFGQKFNNDILEICKPLFNMFNVTYFCQTRAFHNGEFTSLMTRTDITEHYVNKKYPFNCSQGKGIILEPGFHISAYVHNQPQHQSIRQEFRHLFNIDHLIYIVDKHETYDDMFSFATSPDNYFMVNQLINNMDVVKHFLHYYKDKTSNLIRKTTRLSYSSEHLELPNDVPAIIQSTHINRNHLKDMTIKKISISDNDETSISQREFECLGYIAKNHTFKEIAKILNLSPRTVETYANNLKSKLKCENRAQLINTAHKFNLL